MSTGPRIFLGIVSCVVAVAFVLLGGVVAGPAGKEFAKGPWPFYGLAGFSACIGLACLVPGSRPVTLRVLGGAVFAVTAVYLYQDFHTPNMLRALAWFCVFGLPAGYVLATGKYPRWGKAAAAFGGASRPHRIEGDEDAVLSRPE